MFVEGNMCPAASSEMIAARRRAAFGVRRFRENRSGRLSCRFGGGVRGRRLRGEIQIPAVGLRAIANSETLAALGCADAQYCLADTEALSHLGHRLPLEPAGVEHPSEGDGAPANF